MAVNAATPVPVRVTVSPAPSAYPWAKGGVFIGMSDVPGQETMANVRLDGTGIEGPGMIGGMALVPATSCTVA